MKTWVRRTARVGILSAGFLLAGATVAHADTNMGSLGNTGIANGTQANVPVQVPLNVCGNGVGVAGLGLGVSGNCGAAAVRTESTNMGSVANKGILNGTQVNLPIQVPANVSGNGVGVAGVGVGVSGNSQAAAVRDESARTEDTNMVSGRNMGILNGTQVNLPIQVPANVCGNGVGVLGAGVGISGNCGAAAVQESARTEDTNMWSVGNMGILNGTQVNAPIQIPVNVCGNGVGVLGAGIGISGNCGAAAVRGESGHSYGESARTEDTNMVSANNAGILNGTQVNAPIQVPVNVCGNGVGVLGAGVGVSGNCGAAAVAGDGHDGRNHDGGYADEGAEAQQQTMPAKKPAHAVADEGSDTNMVSAGNAGILNGTQVNAPIQVPVNVSGNGVGVAGAGVGISGNSGALALR